MGNENINNNNLVGGFAPSIPGVKQNYDKAANKTTENGGVDGIDWQNPQIDRHINTPNKVKKEIIAKYDEIYNIGWNDENNLLT